MICLYYTVLSVHCSIVMTCYERTDLFALLCVLFYCVFVTLPYDVLGMVWYLILSFSDLCLFYYFRSVFSTTFAWYMCFRTMTYNYKITVYRQMIPDTIAQSEVSLIADPGVVISIPAQCHTFVEIDYEIISTVILLLPLIKEGLLSITSDSMCTQ